MKTFWEPVSALKAFLIVRFKSVCTGGFVLSDLDRRDTESGDNRVHFSTTYEFLTA